MASAGFDLRGDPTHPICPVLLGDARLAQVDQGAEAARGS